MKRNTKFIGVIFFTLLVLISFASQKDSSLPRKPYLGQKAPGMEPEVFAPGIISIPGKLEYCLTFSPDCKEIYFNRAGDGVFVCRWIDDQWSAPEKPNFTKLYTGGEVHITVDGKRMLMNRHRELSEGEQGGIWMLHRIEDEWKNPRFLIPNGMRATATVDGNIYTTDISGYRKKGEDGGIIVHYTLSVAGKNYQRSPNPGGGINTESIDSHPFIDPHERYIIFNSQRDGGIGKSDLYICFKNPDGSWGDAVNMKKLNSVEGDWCATISPDGKYLFYTSNIDQNIHWVDAKIIEIYRPDITK